MSLERHNASVVLLQHDGKVDVCVFHVSQDNLKRCNHFLSIIEQPHGSSLAALFVFVEANEYPDCVVSLEAQTIAKRTIPHDKQPFLGIPTNAL